MANKTINGRIQQKHDTEVNWTKAANFIPKAGEVIVYDRDGLMDVERIKVGDGIHTANELPFIFDPVTRDDIDAICGKETVSDSNFNLCTVQLQMEPGTVYYNTIENGEFVYKEINSTVDIVATLYVLKNSFIIFNGTFAHSQTLREGAVAKVNEMYGSSSNHQMIQAILITDDAEIIYYNATGGGGEK